MATKSIIKDVTIKDKSLARSFVNALEHARTVKQEPIKMKEKITEIKGDKIKEFFD